MDTQRSTRLVDLAFAIELVEDRSGLGAQRAHRDAVRLADGSALLVVVDLLEDAPLERGAVGRWKTALREAGCRSLGPDEVLRILNREVHDAGQRAMASCARLNPLARLLDVACAGAPEPWILRGCRRVVRVNAPPSVELGAIKGAQYSLRTISFERGDALLLASSAWAELLEPLLADDLRETIAPGQWLRARPSQPAGGSVLCLTLA